MCPQCEHITDKMWVIIRASSEGRDTSWWTNDQSRADSFLPAENSDHSVSVVAFFVYCRLICSHVERMVQTGASDERYIRDRKKGRGTQIRSAAVRLEALPSPL